VDASQQKTDLLLKYLETDRKAKDILFQLGEDADQIYGFVYRLKKAYNNDEVDSITGCTDLVSQTPVYEIIKRIGSNVVRLLIQLKRQMDLKKELDPLLAGNNYGN
jgi:hypothetical protein